VLTIYTATPPWIKSLSHPPSPSLSSCPLCPLARVKGQPTLLSREGDLTPLCKVQHVAGLRVNLLSCLITDGEVAFQYDLHLVVRVRVLEWGAGFQAVEATRYRGVFDLVGARKGLENDMDDRLGREEEVLGEDITEVRVFVRNERRLEGGLCLWIVAERNGTCGAHLFGGSWIGVNLAEESAHRSNSSI
jgi:hypothetical protein